MFYISSKTKIFIPKTDLFDNTVCTLLEHTVFFNTNVIVRNEKYHAKNTLKVDGNEKWMRSLEDLHRFPHSLRHRLLIKL